jgi:hypothetical protein
MQPKEENTDIPKEPGITIFNNKTSLAFSLISFMVGELILIHKSVATPIDMSIYSKLNPDSFNLLRSSFFQKQDNEKYIHLNIEESIIMYMLIDLTCKCFVNETSTELEKLALSTLDIDSEDFSRLSQNYIKYGQKLIEKMNEKFNSNELFTQSLKGLREWNNPEKK